MSSKNEGGPAFPCSSAYDNHGGMTLRDWFAGQVLPSLNMVRLSFGDSISLHNATLALDAYRIADAMIKERDK